MERVILHSDMNCFYASVETMLHPELKGKAMAVCGSVEERHGIVLAKSEKAKKAGVKTGMAAWQAKEICPDIIFREPDYPQYVKYSRAAREIYGRFTDFVEPFGMDECWLDMTKSGIFGSGPEIAETLRRTIREELGLTVSVGVSFNKIFAKLGSDMKKPDAVTVLSRENYRQKVWPLLVGDLLYAGPATVRKLSGIGIRTIGDLAATDPVYIRRLLGVNGLKLMVFARGEDTSRVMPKGTVIPPKSIGHGVTCMRDLKTPEEVRLVILKLSQEIGRRLREENALAAGVRLYVRGSDLSFSGFGEGLIEPTRSAREIAGIADEFYREKLSFVKEVRQVTVSVYSLVSENDAWQPWLFSDREGRDRLDRAETAVEEIRGRFGRNAVIPASLLLETAVPDDGRHLVKMPDLMYT
ncbi:MAG: DNA polymerase IV [Eubacteriales bacterium]|nr:DNA polymerase IV [Eubacteriales bacterium]